MMDWYKTTSWSDFPYTDEQVERIRHLKPQEIEQEAVTIVHRLLAHIEKKKQTPDNSNREFKAQEDFYLPVTQQKIKLDPNVTVRLYDLLADSCTDANGYTDLPAMIAYLSNLTLMFTNDVKQSMGEDVMDEVVTLLQSMLPESSIEQQNRESVSQQVLEQRGGDQL